MSHRRPTAPTTRRIGRILVAASAATLLITACGGSAEQTAESIIEEQTGGDVDIDSDTGDVSITDKDGNEFSAGQNVELPDSWPQDVPPFPDGTLITATALAGGEASAQWTLEGNVTDAIDSYSDELVEAGFTPDGESNTVNSFVTKSFVSSAFDVQLVGGEVGGQGTISVTVIPK